MVEKVLFSFRAEVLAILRGLFDPRGRTSRTGLVAFMFLVMILGGLCASALQAIFGQKEQISDALANAGMGLLLVVPTVRRLHDAGFTGWLAFVVTPLFGLKAYGSYLFETLQAPTPSLDYPLSVFLTVSGFAFLAIVLWPPTKGPNRFGPVPPIRTRKAQAT